MVNMNWVTSIPTIIILKKLYCIVKKETQQTQFNFIESDHKGIISNLDIIRPKKWTIIMRGANKTIMFFVFS